MRILLLSICLLSTCILSAQSLWVPMWAQDTATTVCPHDSAQTTTTFTNWEAYQTSNNEWDGPRDSTCIDLFTVVGNFVRARIYIDQIDTTKPVFVRALFDTTQLATMNPNKLYGMFSYSSPSIGCTLDTTFLCGMEPCTKAILGVQVPDSVGSGTELRWHDLRYQYISAIGWFDYSGCIMTEKHATHQWRELIFQYKFDASPPGAYLNLDGVELQEDWLQVNLDSALLTNHWNGSEYQLQSFGGGFGSNSKYVVLHNDSLYPTTTNRYAMNVAPIPNTTIPDTVSIVLGVDATLLFQPFTEVVGAMIVGDTTRHFVEVVNNNGALCLPGFVEVIWGPDSKYLHAGGQVLLESPTACFQFLPQSVLEIAANQFLRFGSYRRGILALRPGASVILQPGAQLEVGHMLDLREVPGATSPGRIEMTLPQNSKLSFAPYASIYNANSIGGNMKLYVYLDGGQVDLSNLSSQDQEKVVIIDLPGEAVTSPLIMGNPVQQDLIIELAVRVESMISWVIRDELGRLVKAGNTTANKGQNHLTVPVRELTSGTYSCTLTHAGTRVGSARFVKL